MVVQYPAVIVHSLADARRVLRVGQPVTLLSAPGAGIYAGALWWKALVEAVCAACPSADVVDVLDCGDSSGAAMAALRTGVGRLILCDRASERAGVLAAASQQGGIVYAAAPPALDLGNPDAARTLHIWLHLRTAPGDSAAPLG